jgi:FAD/FMN-containing dehydrogenase/Fe-S oxidoreductase
MEDLRKALAAVIDGEVRFDAGSRAMYAHDASNYREVPIGVVIPRHVDDVLETLRVCRAHGAPVLGRGGGTSLAGQCVNHAVVMDFSKYMNRVLDIDVANRRVRVEPGLVLDDLNEALAVHGMTFGPDPSTHTHCTLGGMLGNNSCGLHSVMAEFHGPGARTSDHVIEMDIVTYDGLRMRVGKTSDQELALLCTRPDPASEIYRQLVALRDRYADEIRDKYPPVPRRVSGYPLDELLPEHGFHVARALVGTESTCVTILEATLEIYPLKKCKSLVVLGYPSVYEAADHVPQIREFKPIGLEAMDNVLTEDMQKTGLHVPDLSLLPDGKGWLLVEFGGDTLEQSDALAKRMMAQLKAHPDAPTMKLYDQKEQSEHVWKVRESGLGATAYIPGKPDTYEGWEDSAVPPEQLGSYLRKFRALLDRYGFETSLYGHFGQGCVHCRINFDFHTEEGREQYRRFTSEAADLVVAHGGSLSGEHGDGQSRAELLYKQYGDRLVGAFREFKAIWDPQNRMNPHKVVDAAARTEHLKLAIYDPPPVETHFHPEQDHGDFRHAALRCVGIGNCRQGGGAVMCPSFQATHEEKHSTRGRARLLYEMMQGDVITDGWASEEVKDALDLCLSCKGCKGDCPVRVDVATYKSEFLSHYYESHHRPRHAYAFGWIHRWARIASKVPHLANFVTQTPGLRKLAAFAAGLAAERPIPKFAPRTFTSVYRGGRGIGMPVLLWPDTFNNHFFPETLAAAVDVLDDAGFDVIVPHEPVCCGRALYDYGMLDLAERLWERTFKVLDAYPGIPIVGLEPSCVAAFREELKNLFPGRKIHAYTLAELLVQHEYKPPQIHARAMIHGHCHHKAVLGWQDERKLLSAMGLHLVEPEKGCCGLAGSFGYEAAHYDISMAIGEHALLPAIRAEQDTTLVIADGFSCREQVQHGAGRFAYHVAEVLSAALDELRTNPPRRERHDVTEERGISAPSRR